MRRQLTSKTMGPPSITLSRNISMMFISHSIKQYAIAIDFTEYRLTGIMPQSCQARIHWEKGWCLMAALHPAKARKKRSYHNSHSTQLAPCIAINNSNRRQSIEYSTFVFLSTHSSHDRVGLLRFCFFLACSEG